MFNAHFLLTVIAAMCGGPFLYGYNMGVVNTPSPMIREFYTKVYASRAGRYPCRLPANLSSVASAVPITSTNASSSGSANQTSGITNPPVVDQAAFEKKCLKELEAEFSVEILWTFTISICLIGGMIGAFASGRMADKLGRKTALLVNQSFCLIGALLFGIVKVAGCPELMMVGRFLTGVASGVGLGLAPLYLSEVATTNLRGPATSACHLAVTVGIFMSQLLGLAGLLGTQDCWPLLFAVVGVPSLITLCILPFCPETPRYMMTAQFATYEQILAAYQWLYGDVAGEAEATLLCKELARRGHSRASLALSSPQKLAELSGLNASSVEMRTPPNVPGSPSSQNSKVLYTATQEAVAMADCEGCHAEVSLRNTPLKRTASGNKRPSLSRRESISQRAVTLGRLLCSEEFRLPIFLSLWLHVTQQWSGINAVMAYSGSIFVRILPPHLVQYAVLSTGIASCLSTAAMLPFMGRLGRRSVVLVSCAIMMISHVLLTLCSALSVHVPELNFLAVVFIIVYICGYAGTGCTPAVLVSEMFLQNARAIAMSLAIATRWGSAFVLLLAFPYMSDAMGVYVFLVFAFVCLLSLLLFCLWLHETRGKPALQIHDQLAHGFEHVQFHVHMPHLPHMPHLHILGHDENDNHEQQQPVEVDNHNQDSLPLNNNDNEVHKSPDGNGTA